MLTFLGCYEGIVNLTLDNNNSKFKILLAIERTISLLVVARVLVGIIVLVGAVVAIVNEKIIWR